MAKVLARNEVVAVKAVISPYRQSRAKAQSRGLHSSAQFVDGLSLQAKIEDFKGIIVSIQAKGGREDAYEPQAKLELTKSGSVDHCDRNQALSFPVGDAESYCRKRTLVMILRFHYRSHPKR